MRRLVSPVPIAVVLAVIALLALLAYGVSSTGTDASIEEAIASGERPRAPAITLPRLDGRGTGSLGDYRGRVVVLNYWASWCDPCRAESPLLERWHRRIARRGGTVLGIDVLDVTSDAQAFVRRYGLTYPMLRDAEGETQRRRVRRLHAAGCRRGGERSRRRVRHRGRGDDGVAPADRTRERDHRDHCCRAPGAGRAGAWGAR